MMKKEHLKILRGTDFLRCYTEHVKVATRHNKKLYKEIFVMNTTINLSTIFERGVSSKGNNRGVGLSNVREILESYPTVTLKTVSNHFVFKQILEIEIL